MADRITRRDAARAITERGEELGRSLYLEDRGGSYPYRYAIGEVIERVDFSQGRVSLSTSFADGSGTGYYEKSPRDVLVVLALGRFVDSPPYNARFITYRELAEKEGEFQISGNSLSRVGKSALNVLAWKEEKKAQSEDSPYEFRRVSEEKEGTS